jgi:hypothetical protein
MSPSKSRKRGAPPGNLNALKHGYYSQQIKNAVPSDFDPERFSGLKEEIGLIRYHIRRVVEYGQNVEELETALSLLRGICMASTTLTRLIKTQSLLALHDDPISIALRKAVERLDLKISDSDLPQSKKPSPGLLPLSTYLSPFRNCYDFFGTNTILQSFRGCEPVVVRRWLRICILSWTSGFSL